MQKHKQLKPHEQWIIKADSDIRAAYKLLADDDSTLDAAGYHTQQCAEKALKAFLVSKKHSTPKTHSLEKLVEQCCLIDKEFEVLMDFAEVVSPFSTKFRYPGDVLFPEKEDVIEAIKFARKILRFCENKIQKPNLTIFSVIDKTS